MANSLMFKQIIKLARSFSRSLNINLQGKKLIREQCQFPGLIILFLFHIRTLNYYIFILRLDL